MDDLLDRLRGDPCGARAIAAASGLPAHLVGGAVRDLLLGRVPSEIDLAVEGPVDELARRLGGSDVEHERFGTATVRAGDCVFDLAATRAESYARPGALPDVRPAGIDADLARRDLTVNALALDLRDGRLRGAPGALEDLWEGRLRVLHDASFRDDPTRLWRMARYSARLGFVVEPHTAALAAAAVAAGAPATVSGERIGGELRLALAEPDPVCALEATVGLGLLPGGPPDRERVRAALALLPPGEGRGDLVVLGATASADPGALGFTAAEREVVRRARDAPRLARAARAAPSASAVAAALRGEPVEAVVLAGADGAERAVRRWLDELRHVRLAITGDDLLAAGLSPGPVVGRALRHALDLRLDGELGDGRDAQLAAALAEARRA